MITRFEIIDHRKDRVNTPRQVIVSPFHLGPATKVTYQIQDDGQTLKVFLSDSKSVSQISTVDLDPEISKMVDKEFWNLVGDEPTKVDHSIDVRNEGDVVEAFNLFIKKWCGKSYPHLIDSDENDGEFMREKIRGEE